MILLFCALLAFVIGELVALVAFARVRAIYAPRIEGKPTSGRRALYKGLLERLVIYLGLLMGYGVIIAAFGAFKLGTRWKEDEPTPISNDYFLVGNLVSLLVVLGEVLVFRGLLHWIF